MFKTQCFTWRGQRFEIVRYSSAAGRIYHSASERIVVEGMEHCPSPRAMLRAIDEWMGTGRTVRYQGE